MRAPQSASLPTGFARPAARPARAGFSLGEVVLALAVLAIAVVGMLGLIGPTLNAVKQAQDTNSATNCIAKMNSILDGAPFYNTATVYESVYSWVYWSNKGNNGSPTVFIFYDALPVTPLAGQVTLPVSNVVRYNLSTTSMNQPDSKIANNIFTTITDFVQAVVQNRVRGPVIAMTISVSPLVKNFPTKPVDETQWYQAPSANGIFPGVGSMPASPDDYNATTGMTNYPEAYLPILVQAFVLPLDSIDPQANPAAYGKQLVKDLNSNNRVFTYTTAKLR